MVNYTGTMQRLNKEKEYEDKLAVDLDTYFIASLDYIKDMTDEEKKKVRDGLLTIMLESKTHSYRFDMLIQLVLENGETEY